MLPRNPAPRATTSDGGAVEGGGAQHKTKSKESITTCNLQGTFTFFNLVDRESLRVMSGK